MNQQICELVPQLFSRSEIMILDFSQISPGLPEYKNIKAFFNKARSLEIDPKLPENRQEFNNNFLDKTGKRYLIGKYMENRIEMLKGSKIAEEGRTIHLGIDIFSKNLEPVFAPCDAEIVSVGKEGGDHSFGHYIILKPDPAVINDYIFLGHLSKRLPRISRVARGQQIASLGDYINGENGGWSRHLHVQLLKNLPENNLLPQGYTAKENLDQNIINYPDPSFLIFNR